MKYQNMPVGTRFITGDDEYDSEVVKLSSTDAYDLTRGRRENNADDEFQGDYETTGQAVVSESYTDIERVALTMLTEDRSGTYHPALWGYIMALAHDPNERRDLDQWIIESPSNEYVAFAREHGYVCPDNINDREHSAFVAIIDHKPGGDNELDRARGRDDDTALRLTAAVVRYRESGRIGGDQSHTIMGMGAPLLTVTTSLGAAIVEYHTGRINDLCLQMQHPDEF